MIKRPDHMTVDELKVECNRHRVNLCDLEEIHNFTFGRTSVHIGAEKAQNLQAEFEEECKIYKQRIAEIEKELQARSAPQ